MEKTASQQLWIGMIPETPVGPVWVGVSKNGLSALEIGGSHQEFVQALSDRYSANITKDESKTSVVIAQITEYLNGTRMHFDISIDWSVMTAFQDKTLRAVYAIPYGTTRSYGQIADQIGAPNAQRAVGRANATNPIPLVVPCHRVIGADGSLRGYGSGDGIRTKAWLLELEKLHAA
jgi:methylated-DNA-[protein]-cysteine S-methyltransferase